MEGNETDCKNAGELCRSVGGKIVHDIWKRQNVDDEDDKGGDEEVVNCGIP